MGLAALLHDYTPKAIEYSSVIGIFSCATRSLLVRKKSQQTAFLFGHRMTLNCKRFISELLAPSYPILSYLRLDHVTQNALAALACEQAFGRAGCGEGKAKRLFPPPPFTSLSWLFFLKQRACSQAMAARNNEA